MAQTDRGELLTKFEELFGSLVEHEVIKMVLQSCDWNSASASDTLMGMIDQDKLPVHVRNAIYAESVIRGAADAMSDDDYIESVLQNGLSTSPTAPSSDLVDTLPRALYLSETSENMPKTSDDNENTSIEGATALDRSGNVSKNSSVNISRTSSITNLSVVSKQTRPISSNTSLTPFAMAQVAGTQDTCSAQAKPPLWAQASVAPIIPRDERKDIVGADPADFDLSDRDSMSPLSPPVSPTNPNAPELNLDPNRIEETKRWVLAPEWVMASEFVPNARYHQDQNSKADASNDRPWMNWISGCSSVNTGNSIPQSTQEVSLSSNETKIKSKLSKKDEIIQKVMLDQKLMVLMRGLPGSGKSTLAKEVKGRSGVVLSADDFFCDRTGKYDFDRNKLHEAHTWNTNRARMRICEGRTPVIIDNTNLQIWEMQPYVKLGLQHGYEVDILEPETPWKVNPKELARRTIHGVPRSKISDMKGRYDPNITIEHVIDSLKDFRMSTKEMMGLKSPLKPPLSTTEWPTTLPEIPVKNVVEGACFEPQKDSSMYVIPVLSNDMNMAKIEHTPSIKLDLTSKMNSKDVNENISDSLNSIKDYGSDSTNDADVVIEESDDSESDHIDSDKEIDRPLQEIDPPKKENPAEIDLSIAVINQNQSFDSSSVNDNGVIRENNDSEITNVDSEERIRELIEEANNDIGLDECSSDWDDLAKVACEDELDEDKFNDLVSDFGISLKNQLENPKINGVSNPSFVNNANNDDISDDMAMYDLCGDMEDKIGSSISSIISRPKGIVDASSLISNNVSAELQDSDVNQKENSENPPNLFASDTSDCKKEIVTVGVPQACANTSDSLSSWDCIGESATWDKTNVDEKELNNINSTPKVTRNNKRSGDPKKWLNCENDSSIKDSDACSWEPIEGVGSWDCTEEKHLKEKPRIEAENKPSPLTGAVPKMRKCDVVELGVGQSWKELKTRSSSVSPVQMHYGNKTDNATLIAIEKVDNETQTLSIDFEALNLDNNLYELKIIYGRADYIPSTNNMPSENGPLTKGRLVLDKGTMTENVADLTVVKPLQNLVSFFPNIPEDDLRDVLEKCKYDLDWAMNVLLDGGYELAETVGSSNSKDSSDDDVNDCESFNEIATTSSSGFYERLTVADCDGTSIDMPSEVKVKRLKQSQQPTDLLNKKEIENAFKFSPNVDDRVKRLTGKDYDNLKTTKIKEKKGRNKKNSKVKQSTVNEMGQRKENVNTSHEESESETEGAQYMTLVMDSLFASQLVSMFGPIGTCEMSGEMAPEDRSVILPLELCHLIHNYWTKSLDCKFNHEAKVLDNLIEEDELLARKLQDEENKKNDSCLNSSLDNSERVFKFDPPTNFKEIMYLEQALQESQGAHLNENNTPSLASHLSLQRLYTEYPHVDQEALKQEFTESGYNYQETVRRICNRYGSEQGMPKTVIAPEMLYQYEQDMIQRAKEISLAHQTEEEARHLEERISPDDPHVYRDEAQSHYYQRQEAYRKAQEAYSQGMKAVAAYYANIGKLHSEKLNEANHRASLKILEAVNAKKDANVLDLHLLHVPEALNATHAFLAERQQVLVARGIPRIQVSLITGRGAHSVGGQAKLKPAIKELLKQKGLMFHEGNTGMFVVTLKA